jgi:hypothetical protein
MLLNESKVRDYQQLRNTWAYDIVFIRTIIISSHGLNELNRLFFDELKKLVLLN